MRPDRERPSALLPIAVAFVIHALSKGNWFLPPISMLAILASYRIDSPDWWKGRAPLYGAAAILFFPAYFYQSVVLSQGESLYLFWPWLLNAASVMAVVFIALFMYLPPGLDRKWGVPLISFVLVALSGNEQKPLLYAPGVALYFGCLLVHFKLEERRRQVRPRRIARSSAAIGWAGSLAFILVALSLAVALGATVWASEGLMMNLANESMKILGDPDKLRLGSTMNSRHGSWLGESNALYLEAWASGPVPDHFRVMVFHDYNYRSGDWTDVGDEAAVDAPPLERRGAHTVKLIDTISDSSRLPSPEGVARVTSQVKARHDMKTGILSTPEDTRISEYHLAGGDFPLPGPDQRAIEKARAVPPEIREAILDKAIAITEGAESNMEKARKVVEHFDKGYLYGDPKLGRRQNNIVQFLSGDTATGICRNFAESAVMLLRTAGAPSRVVGGFLLRDRGDSGRSYYVVKGRDAHAWIEVHDDASGTWREFDPTPAGPMESALGLNSFYKRRLEKMVDWVRIKLRDLVKAIRGITLADIARLVNLRNMAILAGAVLAVAMAGALYRKRRDLWKMLNALSIGGVEIGERQRAPVWAVTAVYLDFLDVLAELEVSVSECDSGAEVLSRVREAKVDGALFASRCEEFIDVFNSRRFGSAGAGDDDEAAARLGGILAELAEFGPVGEDGVGKEVSRR